MDRRRAGSPLLPRRWTSESAASSPTPRYTHVRSNSASGISSIKRNQNLAAKAAAQRLAQVMASRAGADDDDEEDDLVFANTTSSSPLAFPRTPRMGSPARTAMIDWPASPRAIKVARSQSPVFARKVLEDDAASPPSYAAKMRSALTSATLAETILHRPATAPLQTDAVPLPLMDPRKIRQNEMRLIPTSGFFSTRLSRDDQETSTLQDELDTVLEKNENLLEKLRTEEERCRESEARVKELEKQVATLSEGVSLEAKLLRRKEAILREREEALRNAKPINTAADDEVAALHSKAKDLEDAKAATIDQLHRAENEVRILRSTTSRIVLTQKEMEEVVLKRCWLSRYWGLALRYGFCEDAAVSKHEHWSSLAPLPFEVVLSAGQKAKEQFLTGSGNSNRSELVQDFDLSGDTTVESLLSVEMGLKELSSLKVEDAILRALSEQRSSGRSSLPELSAEESEDVLFKKAWLTYFWRRAQTVGIEEHIATERLNFWTEHSSHAPTSHDVVAVEEGLVELRKLGIEQRLWTATHKDN